MTNPPLLKVLKIFLKLKWEESRDFLGISFGVIFTLCLFSFGFYWLGVGTFNLEAKIWYDCFPKQRMVLFRDRDYASARDISYDEFLILEYERTFIDEHRFPIKVWGIPDAQPTGYWFLGSCNIIKIVFVLGIIGGIVFVIVWFVRWIMKNWYVANMIARREM